MSLTPDIREVLVEHYYPNTVSPSKEFKTLAEVEDSELNTLWQRLWRLFANTFVYDIDVKGAERWESMLSIKPPVGATLSDRRQAILAKINASLPYTERSFQNMLDGVYGRGNVKLTCHYNRYAITLDLVSGILPKWQKIKTYARAIIPANLAIMVSNTKAIELEKVYAGGWVKMFPRITIGINDTWSADNLKANEHYAGYATRTERTWI